MKKQIDEMIEDKLTMSKETKETLESILEKGLAKIRSVVLGPDLRLTIPKNAFDAGFNFDEVNEARAATCDVPEMLCWFRSDGEIFLALIKVHLLVELLLLFLGLSRRSSS